VIDRATALDLIASEVPDGLQVDTTEIRELRTGWFLPFSDPNFENFDPEDICTVRLGGPKGVVVNKQTGARLVLGSAFPLERDLALYDKGYQFHYYDLVVTKIVTMQQTLDTLQALHISVTEPTYKHGTVWRISRRLTRAELQSNLGQLPHVFAGLPLSGGAEVLETAREKGFFQFELLECRW
jgi:hypothetical protein